jgi:DNA primase
MDVITSHQAGFTNTVASSGTAVTPYQIELLKRYTDTVIFALDADAAGQMAIDKGGEVASDQGGATTEAEDRFGRMRKYLDPNQSINLNIKVAAIPEGKDPDDFIRMNPEGWAKVVEGAVPLMEYYFNRSVFGLDLSGLDGRKAAVKRFLPRIALLSNEIDRGFWLKRLAQAVSVEEGILKEHLRIVLAKRQESQTGTPYRIKKMDQPASVTAPTKDEILTETFLAILLKFENISEFAFDRTSIEHLSGAHNKDIYKKFILYYNSTKNNINAPLWQEQRTRSENGSFLLWYNNNLDESGFDEYGEGGAGKNREADHLRKLILAGERDLYELSADDARKEMAKICRALKQRYLDVRIREASALITELERKSLEDPSVKAELDMMMGELGMIMEEKKLIDEGA